MLSEQNLDLNSVLNNKSWSIGLDLHIPMSLPQMAFSKLASFQFLCSWVISMFYKCRAVNVKLEKRDFTLVSETERGRLYSVFPVNCILSIPALCSRSTLRTLKPEGLQGQISFLLIPAEDEDCLSTETSHLLPTFSFGVYKNYHHMDHGLPGRMISLFPIAMEQPGTHHPFGGQREKYSP